MRLLREVDSVRAGSLGRVFGFMRSGSHDDAYVVAFDAGPSRILEQADLELVATPTAPGTLD